MAWIIGVLIAILIAGRSHRRLVIEYEWWKEMGQICRLGEHHPLQLRPAVAGGVDRVCRPLDRPCACVEDRRDWSPRAASLWRGWRRSALLVIALSARLRDDRRLDHHPLLRSADGRDRRSGGLAGSGIR